MTNPDGDFLSDFWRILKEHNGMAAADRELVQLRAKWGGQRIYLKKPPGDRIQADRDSTRARPRPRKTWA